MTNKFIKMVSIAMIACMGLAIASCGKKDKGMTINEGKLVMATNAFFPPYEYYDGNDITPGYPTMFTTTIVSYPLSSCH